MNQGDLKHRSLVKLFTGQVALLPGFLYPILLKEKVRQMIVLENITKRFELKGKTVEAVKDVNLTIDNGEIYGIIGFSGAGKSTLVRCINLLERPTEGRVLVDNVDLLSLSDKELLQQRKHIGMIFQQFNLMPSRTVAQNIALPLERSGLTKEAIGARVQELLEFVELGDKAERFPSQLSGGQKQRVAIARALATKPDILLCDEATSALDPQTTKSILDLLVKLNNQLGITVVVITHEMQVIKKICHRVAVMEQGRVVEEGKVFDVFSAPTQAITKAFINTTSNLSEIYSLIDEQSPIVDLAQDESIIKIQYQKVQVSEPLISMVSKKFAVTLNVLFSDVEIVDGFPIGGSVAIIKGEQEQIAKAYEYIRSKGVSVEVIKDAAA